MNARRAVVLAASLLAVPAWLVAADSDEHAHALARASCQSGNPSAAVTEAAAALERDPDDLGPRVRLADALVDQGCYQEAVRVLEGGEQAHPHNSLLAGKLRDVRSLVTEQTYIEGLTQAAETAKFQRNQLRCTRLADVTACEDALKLKPGDEQLLSARAQALQMKAQEEAQDTASSLADAPPVARVAVSDTAKPSSKHTRRAVAQRAESNEAPATATVASLQPLETRTYSNDAAPGRTN